MIRPVSSVPLLPPVSDTGIRTMLTMASTAQLHPGKQSRKSSVDIGIREEYLVQQDLRKETYKKKSLSKLPKSRLKIYFELTTMVKPLKGKKCKFSFCRFHSRQDVSSSIDCGGGLGEDTVNFLGQVYSNSELFHL